MSVTGLSCMFQRRPARAGAETGGVISLHLSLFLPPAGLSFSLLFCHTLSLSHPFLSSASLLPSCVSTVTLLSSFPLQISRDPSCLSETTSTLSQLNLKMLFTCDNTVCSYVVLVKNNYKKTAKSPLLPLLVVRKSSAHHSPVTKPSLSVLHHHLNGVSAWSNSQFSRSYLHNFLFL